MRFAVGPAESRNSPVQRNPFCIQPARSSPGCRFGEPVGAEKPYSMRLEDGTFYGFEGLPPCSRLLRGLLHPCMELRPGAALPFPGLERSMREADYQYNLRPDGGMPFRLQLPLGSSRSAFRPCADGQFGGVMKAYRDWKISGDTSGCADCGLPSANRSNSPGPKRMKTAGIRTAAAC